MKKIQKSRYSIHLVYLLAIIAMTTIAVSCKKDKDGSNHAKASSSPQAARLAPDSAAGNNVLTLTGSGLGDMRSIVFDSHNVPATFNPDFNTDGAVIFR